MAKRAIFSSLLLACLSTWTAARATEFEVETHGSYRFLLWNQTDLPLGVRDAGESAERLGQTFFLEHRLRAGTRLGYGSLSFELELDVLNGLLNAPDGGIMPSIPLVDGGTPRPQMADPRRNLSYGRDFNSFAVRKAMLEWRTPVGKFALGPTVFTFGQGMLANDGAGPLDAVLADQRFGDRVARAMFATQPFGEKAGFTAALAFDLLLEDETGMLVSPGAEKKADSQRGFFRDTGLQGVLLLAHKLGGYSSGLFVTRRSITFPKSYEHAQNVTVPFRTDLQVWVTDLAARYERAVAERVKLYGAFEGALVMGTTNYVRNSDCPGDSSGTRCEIWQQGLVARVGARLSSLNVDLMGGYASGDGNPFDNQISNFRFDRDFKAGLILFDQVLAWQSAATVRRATDPALMNVPNAGVEMLSTSGSITNALFLQPTITWRPIEAVSLVGSALWARAPQGYTDALWTNRTSDKTNPFGQPAGKNYGLEVDLGASYTHKLQTLTKDGLQLVVGVQGGLFLPGDAFAMDASGKRMDPVYLVKARTGIVF